jgi:hemoglobin
VTLTSPYDTLQEAGVRALVGRFYDHMDALPEAATIRALHVDLDRARELLFLFLSGWLGGPPLYIERFGHPRLRARHLPFPIGEAERDEWLLCMGRALDECVSDDALREQLRASFAQVADHMRNRAPPG